MPAGGNLDDWQAGKSIRDWNNAELERQRAAGSVPLPEAPIAPVRQPPFSLYRYSIPLWPLGLIKRVVGS
jgi:hypothetical protein